MWFARRRLNGVVVGSVRLYSTVVAWRFMICTTDVIIIDALNFFAKVFIAKFFIVT